MKQNRENQQWHFDGVMIRKETPTRDGSMELVSRRSYRKSARWWLFARDAANRDGDIAYFQNFHKILLELNRFPHALN